MKTILIVEDDRLTCFLLQEAFALFSKEYTVRIAGDGSEALRITEKEHIDVILTDIMMPVMDGFELIASVRAQNRDIPIYVMTSYSPSLMEERLKGLDITGYFPKPYDLQEMISCITHPSGEHNGCPEDTALARTAQDARSVSDNQ